MYEANSSVRIKTHRKFNEHGNLHLRTWSIAKNETKYECPFNSKDDTRHNDRPAPLICLANFLRASLDRASVVTGRVYLFISDVKIRHRGFKMLGAQKNKSRIAFEIFTSFGTEQDSVQAVKITDLTTIAPVATSRTCTTHIVQK